MDANKVNGSILFITDKSEIIQPIREALKVRKIHLLVAPTIEAALDLLNSVNICTIILDAAMSDAMQAAEIVRIKYSAIIPIVILVRKYQNINQHLEFIGGFIDDIILYDERKKHPIDDLFLSRIYIAKARKKIFYNHLDKKVQELLQADLERIRKQFSEEFLREHDVKVTIEFLKSLNKALEAKDSYTQGHSERVAWFASKICEQFAFKPAELSIIYNATILHDIGKIGVDMKWLSQKKQLSDEDWARLKQHPKIGHEIAKSLAFLTESGLDIILHHHERWDGKGYPDGIKGNNIKLQTAVVVIADAFDAMTSNRFYRKSMTYEQAYEEINKNSGTQFHPDITDTAIEVLKELVKEEKENGNIS